MATATQAAAEVAEWIATAPGLFMDGDQAHGYQCKDVADDYASKLFGVKPGVALGYGNAKHGLTLASRKYFDIVVNDPAKPNQLPPKGALIVWEGTEVGGLNEYGHIAVNVAATAAGPTVIQQDGYLQVAAHVATLGWWNAGTGMVAGWAVPKASMVKYTGADKRGFGPAPSATVAVQAARSYTLVTSRRSPNYTPAAQVPSVFGHARKVLGITIHWWDTPARAGSLEGTTAWLTNKASGVSAHAVISGTTVNEIVSPADAAWHAGNAQGNAVSVGIELDPNRISESLPTVIAYCADLERRYGSLLFYGHRDWTTTECPGDYYTLLDKIIGGVNAALAAPPAPAPAKPVTPARPAPAPAPVKKSGELDRKTIADPIGGRVAPLHEILTFRFTRYQKGLDRITALEKRVSALEDKE